MLQLVRYRISHAPRSQSPLAMQSWQHKCKRNTTQTIAHKMLLLVNTPDRCALCSLHSPACTHLNQNLALLGLTQRYIHTWAWQWNTHQIWDMNEIRLNRQWPCLHYVFIVWEEVFTWCFQSTVNCYSDRPMQMIAVRLNRHSVSLCGAFNSKLTFQNKN